MITTFSGIFLMLIGMFLLRPEFLEMVKKSKRLRILLLPFLGIIMVITGIILVGPSVVSIVVSMF